MLLDDLARPPAVEQIALHAEARGWVEVGREERHVPQPVLVHLREREKEGEK